MKIILYDWRLWKLLIKATNIWRQQYFQHFALPFSTLIYFLTHRRGRQLDEKKNTMKIFDASFLVFVRFLLHFNHVSKFGNFVLFAIPPIRSQIWIIHSKIIFVIKLSIIFHFHWPHITRKVLQERLLCGSQYLNHFGQSQFYMFRLLADEKKNDSNRMNGSLRW